MVRWAQLNIGRTGFRADPVEQVIAIQDDGRYIVCDVPTEAPLLVQATARDSTGAARIMSGEVSVRFAFDTLLAHRDLYVAPIAIDSSSPPAPGDSVRLPRLRGTARLVGRVLAEGGKPVNGARIAVRDAGAEATTDSSGVFHLGGLPLGTRSVVMIAIGYTPVRTSVDLTANADATLTLRLTKRVQELDEVSVSAKIDRTGFERRRKQGNGFFLDAADIERKGAFRFENALFNVPGMRVVGTDHLTGRPVFSGRFRCTPSFFLDGFAADVTKDIAILPISAIGGIEVYANQPDVPPQYSGLASGSNNGGCTTVLVWTKSYVH
jgi:hypothetical protein